MTQLGWFRYQKIRTRKNSRFNSFYRFNFLPRQTNVVEVDTFDPFVISITAQIAGLCQQVIIMFWSWRRKQIILKMNLSWAEPSTALGPTFIYLIFIGNVNCAWHWAERAVQWYIMNAVQVNFISDCLPRHRQEPSYLPIIPNMYSGDQHCTITICKYHSQVSKGVNVNVIPWNTIFRAYYRLLFAECTLCLVPFIYFHA